MSEELKKSFERVMVKLAKLEEKIDQTSSSLYLGNIPSVLHEGVGENWPKQTI